MNIHHLELFYYVARHKGIAGAVRNMPYGIQQPAVTIGALWRGKRSELSRHIVDQLKARAGSL